MDYKFQVDYQTIDQTKRMMVQAPDKPTAQARAEDYLKSKYGEIFTVLGIEQDPRGELWERIVDYVITENSYRHDCETESDAEELVEKIETVFQGRNLADCFWAIRFGTAVHIFPVYHISKGSIAWRELNGENEQDMGRHGKG